MRCKDTIFLVIKKTKNAFQCQYIVNQIYSKTFCALSDCNNAEKFSQKSMRKDSDVMMSRFLTPSGTREWYS